MKRFLFIFILFTSPMGVSAQHVVVAPSIVRITNIKCGGYKTALEGTTEQVTEALKKELRNLGKMRERNTYFHITEVKLGGEYFENVNFYAELKPGETKQIVWFGVDSTGMSGDTRDFINGELEKLTYHFGVNFYKGLVQAEIDESSTAEQFTVRKIKRLERELESLKTQLEDNEKELIRLEQEIEANKLQHLVLEQKITDNVADHEESMKSLEKIQKVIEAQRKKQEAIR